MMQIDCEVLDTHLIHVKYGAIPHHLRTEGNSTQTFNDLNEEDKTNNSTRKQYKDNSHYMPYFINTSSIDTAINSNLYKKMIP